MTIRHLIALLLVTLLAACGGGQANTDVSAGAATRIEIAPNALLLTATGQKKLLAAKVFDAAGNTVQTQVEWTSSHPENIAVDASGAVTAISDGGSSQIIARIGTVQSPPLLAVHTQLPAGAVLLTDANIIGESEETTPGAVANIGNTYQVQLTGVPEPEVGSLLINTEGKVVGGRVQAVQTTNGVHRVTLALVPAREMFPQLNINEVIDLNQAEVAIPTEIQAQYDVQREGNTFTFTPKPGQMSLTASLVQKQPMASSVVTSSSARTSRTAAATAPVAGGDFKLGPFVCKPALDGAAGAGSQIIALTIPPLFVITLNPKLDVLSTLANGLERFVVHAEPTASFEWGLKTLAAFEGKVTCDAELFTIRVPAGGPLALVIGGQIPIGVGVEVGGKITVASMTSTLKGVVKTTVDVGLACPGGTNCSVVKTFGPLTFSGVPTFDVPSLNDFRFEPTASAYTFVKASIGNPFLTSLRFDAFKVKAGAALKGNFAPQRVQTGDAQYSSDYKLVSELKAGADTGFTGLAGFLGLNAFAETVLEISADLGTTPIGTVSADVAQFSAGDTFNVAVKLDPKMTGFVPLVGPYNVDRIVLVRQDATGATGEVASVIARDGQTDFNFSLKATASGRTDEFFAFVVTRLLPTDVFSLELGRATTTTVNNLRQTVNIPAQLTGPTPFTVIVETQTADGVFVPVPGATVSIDNVSGFGLCGSVDRPNALTNADGVAAFTATPTASCLQLSFFVSAGVSPTLNMVVQHVTPAIVFPVFDGDLVIGYAGAVALAGHLEEVTGSLFISSVQEFEPFTSISLPNLKKVGGRLDVGGRGALTSVQLPALLSVGNEFVVSGFADMPSVLTLFHAPLLKQVARAIRIRNNPLLTTVVIGPVKVGLNFDILNNGFPNFSGFSPGIEVGNDLQISGNTGFSDQTARDFANLVTVTGLTGVSRNTGP